MRGRAGAGAVAAALLLAACGSGGHAPAGSPAQATAPPAASAARPSVSLSPSAVSAPASSTAPTAPSSSSSTSSSGVRAAGALAGAVVVIDPGHDGGNARHPEVIARLVDSGNGRKACDTAGTQTDAGYTEAAFTWDLAQRLAARLRADGARVVLTRAGNDGVGPCVTERAAIGNRAAAGAARAVAVSLHADGGPPGGYGFHVIEPGRLPPTAPIVAASARLGAAVRDAFRAGTGEPVSTYTGTDGVTVRTDLAGLDLSTVPKVFIECGNMRNASDATRLTDPSWRERAAVALEQGLRRYLGS